MRLLEPLTINGLTLPNRVVVPAMVTRLSGEDGFVNEAVRDRYLRYAQGHVGLIVVEATAIHESKSGPLLRLSRNEYIAGHPLEVQAILQKIRQIVMAAAPGATETISYQMPTFRLNGGNLVHFAAFKKHIGFYPTPSGTEQFRHQLAAYKGGKGSVQFPLDQPMPYDLIRQIVEFRVAESRARAEARAGK